MKVLQIALAPVTRFELHLYGEYKLLRYLPDIGWTDVEGGGRTCPDTGKMFVQVDFGFFQLVALRNALRSVAQDKAMIRNITERAERDGEGNFVWTPAELLHFAGTIRKIVEALESAGPNISWRNSLDDVRSITGVPVELQLRTP